MPFTLLLWKRQRARPRLCSRFDAKTFGKQIYLTRKCVSPPKIKTIKDATAVIERWEDSIRRLRTEYNQELDDGLKQAILLEMIPTNFTESLMARLQSLALPRSSSCCDSPLAWRCAVCNQWACKLESWVLAPRPGEGVEDAWLHWPQTSFTSALGRYHPLAIVALHHSLSTMRVPNVLFFHVWSFSNIASFFQAVRTLDGA